MFQSLRGPVTVLGRLLLVTIFLLAAVGNKIPHFSQVAGVMQAAGVPAPQFMLVGAIAFLIVGSLSVLLGFKARVGAALLLTFLVLATYYFHPFWKLEGQAQQEQMIQFMKNLSMMGAMLLVMANGSGPMSLDCLLARRAAAEIEEQPQRARRESQRLIGTCGGHPGRADNAEALKGEWMAVPRGRPSRWPSAVE